MNLHKYLFFLSLTFGCAAQNAGGLVSHTLKSPLAHPKATICKDDQDCTLISESCCGCNQGGKRVAVNKTFASSYEDEKSKECASTLCMQVISQDPSCVEWTNSVCVDNRCLGK